MLWGQRESRVRAAMLVRDGGVAVEGQERPSTGETSEPGLLQEADSSSRCKEGNSRCL